jgi:hypothetical protein
MSAKGAKLSFRKKTLDCQYCDYRSERNIPNTDITVNFCTVNLPKIVYQLRGVSQSRCNTCKHKSII